MGPNLGKTSPLPSFGNIAGRAGRALRDRLGLIVFPVKEQAQLQQVREFLRGEAEELASSLVGALAGMSALGERFDREFVRRNPSLSVFLQYLTHAMRVGGVETGRSELEDLLRSSLVYHQVQEEDRSLAEKLVDLATRYLDVVRQKNSGYLALADGTGFSLSSVDYLYAMNERQHPEFSTTDFWRPESLFTDPEHLSSVISILAEVPELSLGRTDFGIFNPDAVAGVLQQWVSGASVSEIADEWFSGVEDDPDKRRRNTSVYLYSKLVGQVPWGIGAIQRLSLTDPDQREAVGHIPSLIFYGVSTREAAELRMAGVPRIAAQGLAVRWREHGDAASFSDVREWLSQLDNRVWDSALPAGASLTGEECVNVWRALGGVPI
jgi:helicase